MVEFPILPIDPADVGRSYDSIIRVNSQSGKGGIAYLLENTYGLVMPRRMQVEFSGVVQRRTDETGAEVSSSDLWQLFTQEYLQANAPLCYVGHHLFEHGKAQGIRLTLETEGRQRVLSGEGNGPIEATILALGIPVRVLSYEERSLGTGADAKASAFIEVALEGYAGTAYGVGVDANIITASVRAALSGINRLLDKRGTENDPKEVLLQAIGFGKETVAAA